MWVAIFLLITLPLIAGGYWYAHAERELIRQDKYQELAAIAGLKVGQIKQWRQERMADAWIAAMSPFFSQAAAEYIRKPYTPGLRTEIIKRLQIDRGGSFYSNVLLLNTNGDRILTARDNPAFTAQTTIHALHTAINTRKTTLSDFFRCSDGKIYIDTIAPVFDSQGVPLAALILRSNANAYLYPLIQLWPMPSRSGETLLVERDRQNVLFLNDIRNNPNAALNLRIPLTRRSVPAVQAALGIPGIFQGVDYRGKKVLADIRPIPGTPWYMVAKIDTSEIMAEAHYRTLIVDLFVFLGVLVTAALTALGYRHLQADMYHDMYRLEKENREAHEVFRTTLYSIGDAVITTDTDGRVREMNQIAEQLTGWTEAEGAGKPLDEVFHIISEETRALVENPAARVLREGHIVGLANHTLLVARDGTENPIADSGAPIRSETGEITGVVLVFRDQSVERDANRALKEALDRYRELANNMGSGVAVYDAVDDGEDFIFKDFNLAAERIDKVKREDVLGKSVRKMFPMAAEYGFLEVFRRVWRTGIPEKHPITFYDDNRIQGWHENFVYKLPTGELVAIYDDVTDRMMAEKALRQSEARLLQAQAIAHVGNWELDISSQRMWGSEEAFRIYGVEVPSASLQFDQLAHIPLEEERSRLDKAMNDLLYARGAYDLEFRIIRPNDGEIRVIHTMADLLYDEKGEPEKVVGVIQDVTERKRAEEEQEKLQAQLRQAQKMEAVGRLAGGVAHDFNNMLSVIIGYSEIALSKLDASDALFAHLQEIMKAARRSADLTRQLLAFARKQTIAPKVLDLNYTIHNMLQMLHRLIGEDITLQWKPAKSIWPLKIDPAQIDQILANLTINARDAISGIGRIIIETGIEDIDEDYCSAHSGFVPGQYTTITFSDNGCGMDNETLAHIFEPFFTTKPMGQGTGLGLATVYGIVKQNNGFINVYSEPGMGTTFRIYLPKHSTETERSHDDSARVPAPPGTETVLLVEDEASVLNLSLAIMEQLGYTVLAASSPGKAIQFAEEFKGDIDLLITDVVMPEMNGRDLKERLITLRPGLKCIFISGYTADVIAHHGVLEEGVHFLQKPFTMASFAAKLREALSD
jgi:PAS domain S-box-containing protein